VKLANAAHEDVEGYLGAVLARWRPATAHNDRALRGRAPSKAWPGWAPGGGIPAPGAVAR
jgi:hypothetical protein